MKLLRVKAAAKQYSISIYSFYKWNETGKFPGLFVKIGRILFVDETELRRIARASKPDVASRRVQHAVTLLTDARKKQNEKDKRSEQSHLDRQLRQRS